ncbi:hypothetical protein JCM8097_003941 [Rhodosporidiobolus ruineniae]
MATSLAATNGTEPSTDAQIATLQSLLASLDRTRSSLPSLLTASLHLPAASPSDRAQLYRTASTECTAALRALSDALQSAQPVLDAAEASDKRDSSGVVVRPREKRREGNAWETVATVLGESRVQGNGKGKSREPFKPQFDPPTSLAEVAVLVRRWGEQHPRVQLQLVGAAERGGPREVRVRVRGLMQAVVALRWEKRREGEERVCVPELVVCHSLKEKKPPHLPSQFTLFQQLTNTSMALVDRQRALRAAGKGGETALEEVLAFLSNPPLPF